VSRRPRGIWRWHELLPVDNPANFLTLGEGDAPLLRASNLAKQLQLPNLYIKDESNHATASFKARGMVVAISKAIELGLREFVIPTAGNAGGALAAYAARAGCRAHVFMPADTPIANKTEVRMSGADLILVDGLINDAAKLAREAAAQNGWFDVSTFKEPFRVEGKKTMGYELAEGFGWELPDVILYPTGGGTGLVGMWKAFAEMEALGWIGSARPRMVSVQATDCAPVVKAFKSGAERCEVWQNASTVASGLRVPAVFADRLILQALRESHGTAVAVTDDEILSAQKELASSEGIFAAPEGAATLAALKHLIAEGWIKLEEKIVLFNTGSGLKYVS
jgi:threonine synthase